MKGLIHFLNIYALLYSEFRLIKIKYENFDNLFKKDINSINSIYNGLIKISIIDNIFHIEIKSTNSEILFLTDLLLKNDELNIETILKLNEENDYSCKGDIKYLFTLLSEIGFKEGNNLTKDIEYYKDKSHLIYNLLQANQKTFRGDKNLLDSMTFINELINNYDFSVFYLFRIRNLFLYYYQYVIGRNKFYDYLINDRKYIYNSKYIKLIFLDLQKSKILNKNNKIINLFEGVTLLHLLDSKGVDILLDLKGKIDDDIFNEHIYIWLSNYYIDIGNFQKAEDILSQISGEKTFKYYRKYFVSLIMQNKYEQILTVIKNLVLIKKEYKISFFHKGNENLELGIKNINLSKQNNDNLNFILDIEETKLIMLLNKQSNGLNIDLNLLNYLSKDYKNYFLNNNSTSIILEKI